MIHAHFGKQVRYFVTDNLYVQLIINLFIR